jgi:glyceraldehyde-3-phosphate dehydrogenase (NAD(P))
MFVNLRRAVVVLLAVCFVAVNIPQALALKPGSAEKKAGLKDIIGSLKKSDDKQSQADGGFVVSAEKKPDIRIFAQKTIAPTGKKDAVGQAVDYLSLKVAGVIGAIAGHSFDRQKSIGESTALLDSNKPLTQKIKDQILSKLKGAEVSTTREIAFLDYDIDLNKINKDAVKNGFYSLNCLGSERKNLPLDEEIADILKQAKVDFQDITLEDLSKGLIISAYEPAGKIGTGQGEDPAVIGKVHQAFFDWMADKYGFENVLNLWGTKITLLYGASIDGKNIDGIMEVKSSRKGMEGVRLVHGGLFASSGKKFAGLLPVADRISKAGATDGKKYICALNLKSFEDIDNPEAYVHDIFMASKDGRIAHPENLIIVISDMPQRFSDWRTAIARESADFDQQALTGLNTNVVKTETIGSFTKATLGKMAQADRKTLHPLDAQFKEARRSGDNYFMLTKGDVAILAKQNDLDQTLMTVPLMDISKAAAREKYYSTLLEYAAEMTKNGEGLELIEQTGDEFRKFLSKAKDNSAKSEDASFAAGDAKFSGKKYWWGTERFFQMEYKAEGAGEDVSSTLLTFKPSRRELVRGSAKEGVSLIVQPKKVIGIVGYGTIGQKAADAARRSGFFVVVTARSVKMDSIDAWMKGYPIYFMGDEKSREEFKKSGIALEMTLEEALAAKKIDLVIDATPGKIGAENVKNIYSKYPDLKIVMEGGEKESESIPSFNSLLDYMRAWGAQIVRVVSCNTTGMGRAYGPLVSELGLGQLYIRNQADRRGADPADEKGINPDSMTIILNYHHGPDFLSVLEDEMKANIAGLNTDASEVSMTHFHVHTGTINLKGGGLTVDKVKEILSRKSNTRLALVDMPKSEFKTTTFVDIFQSMLKNDANHPFIVAVQVSKSDIPGDVKLNFIVPQESNVVPENVNAIQSMFRMWRKDAAIRVVDETLRIDQIKEGVQARLPVKAAAAKDGGTQDELGPFRVVSRSLADYGNKATYEGQYQEPFKTGDELQAVIFDANASWDVKENAADQTMMVIDKKIPMLAAGADNTIALTSLARLLEYAYAKVNASNKGLELIINDGDLIKRFLSASADASATSNNFELAGIIKGTKYWSGDDRFFQLEYAPGGAENAKPMLITFKTNRKSFSGGVSMIIQPKKTIAVVGYGTIGQKVADALRNCGFFVKVTARSVKRDSIDAYAKGYPILFAGNEKDRAEFDKAGIKLESGLEEQLAAGLIDAVVDATPSKIGSENLKNIYSKYPNLKVVFEGGEKEQEGFVSFNSFTDFEAAVNANKVRVVSCNTTGMGRVYGALLKWIKGLIIDNTAYRRAADPADEKGINPDSMSMIPGYHHGPDFLSVLPAELKARVAGLNTDAAEVNMTHFHVHKGILRLKGGDLTVEKVKAILMRPENSRICVVDMPKNEFRTTTLVDVFQGMLRNEATHPYIITVSVAKSSVPGEVLIEFAVPQESNVVPENVNALQAMFDLWNRDAAIRVVDETMRIDWIKEQLAKRLPAKVPAVKEEVSVAPWKTTVPNFEKLLADLPDEIIIRGDGNVLNDEGNLEDENPLRLQKDTEAMARILDAAKAKGKKVKIVYLTHIGKPKGKVVAKLSAAKITPAIDAMMAAKGHPGVTRFLEGSITEKGVKPGLADEIQEGVNVVENVRFSGLEEKRNSDFAKALAGLVHNKAYVFNGFGSGASENASVLDIAKYAEAVYSGPLVEEEMNQLIGIKRKLRVLMAGGGPKLKQKVPMFLGIINEMGEGSVFDVGSGPAPLFWKVRANIDLVPNLERDFKDELAAVAQCVAAADARGIKLLLPVDFKVTKKGGTEKYNLTIDEWLKPSYTTPQGEVIPMSEMTIVDVGTDSIELSINELKTAVGTEGTVFWNGVFGIDNIEESSDVLLEEVMLALGDRFQAGGGDTGEYLQKKANARGKTIKVSTGGGAGLTVMETESIPVVVELEVQQARIETARLAGLTHADFESGMDGEKSLYNNQGGKEYDRLVAKLDKPLEKIPYSKMGAFIVGSNYAQTPATIMTVKQTAPLDNVLIVLVGDKVSAERQKSVMGNTANIIVVPDLVAAKRQLESRHIDMSLVSFLGTAEDAKDQEIEGIGYVNIADDNTPKPVAFGKALTLAVSKAVPEANQFFKEFYGALATGEKPLIDSATYARTKDFYESELAMLDFTLSANSVKLTETVEMSNARADSQKLLSKLL